MNDILELIDRENNKRYDNVFEVEKYLKQPYHALRVSLAIKTLDYELNQSFLKTEKSEIKILELGGSTGSISKKIMDLGYNVIVSDKESIPLEVAKKRGLECLKFDVNYTFPIENESFDAIFAGEIIEHLYDTELFLSECNRILKNDGILVLTTPNLATLQDRIKFLFGISPKQVDPLHEHLRLHIRPFTYSKLRELLSLHGFHKYRLTSNYLRLSAINKKIQRFLAKLFPSLGGSLIVSARKK